MTNDEKVLFGKILVNQILNKEISSLKDVEFKIFSQFGDDGIIQWLIHNIDIDNEVFVEFGVENYKEANTKFLMFNNNWSGFVMDGSKENIENLKKQDYFWRYNLKAKDVFITKENINDLLLEQNIESNVGLLHIDLDGNDYYIFDEINCLNPNILILEYNSLFGIEREISVPYREDFYRTEAHYSNLYFGASLKALHSLAYKKGFVFIGCNQAGNNAYFVRKDKVNSKIKEVSLQEGYVKSKFRESRDKNGKLNFLDKVQAYNEIKGLPIYNTHTKEEEVL
ncbi:hypothetical protein [Aliarcobacter skirrowii]|uniref:hypothetical protein n=1 Tax=Aliarcobacter skirrowii TaxID=28200 RepID=UPI000AF9254B|nr:hypothetical protein [Aliarcobacter skirrowii]